MTVWAPALPPVPISSGMKNDSATTAASSPSKWRSTVPVRVPRHEQQHQPADALAHHRATPGCRSRACPGARLDGGHAQDVLGLLLDHDVDDVVHGHEADHARRPSPAPAPPAGCTSRSCGRPPPGRPAAATVIGLRRMTSVSGRSSSAITRSRRETAPRSRPVSGLQHVAGVDRLLLAGDRAEVLQRVAHRHARLEAHELGGHDAARGVGRVLEQAAPPRRASADELGQQAAPLALAHAAHDLGALVGGELSRSCAAARPGSSCSTIAARRRRVGWSRTSTARGTGSMVMTAARLLQRELVHEVGHVHVGQLGHAPRRCRRSSPPAAAGCARAAPAGRTRELRLQADGGGRASGSTRAEGSPGALPSASAGPRAGPGSAGRRADYRACGCRRTSG